MNNKMKNKKNDSDQPAMMNQNIKINEEIFENKLVKNNVIDKMKELRRGFEINQNIIPKSIQKPKP